MCVIPPWAASMQWRRNWSVPMILGVILSEASCLWKGHPRQKGSRWETRQFAAQRSIMMSTINGIRVPSPGCGSPGPHFGASAWGEASWLAPFGWTFIHISWPGKAQRGHVGPPFHGLITCGRGTAECGLHVLWRLGEDVRLCPSLYEVLREYGILGPAIRSFRFLLVSVSELALHDDSKVGSFSVRVGLCQGCPLSHILFIIFIKRICKCS